MAWSSWNGGLMTTRSADAPSKGDPSEALRVLFQTVNPTPNWEPTWNMAPTRDAPVVRLHPETRARHLDLLRWGLVPHWAKDAKSVRQPINAPGRDPRHRTDVPRS
jgi:putative SOS response-associated peptidase YedK